MLQHRYARMLVAVFVIAAAAALYGCTGGQPPGDALLSVVSTGPDPTAEHALANDNRSPAGALRDGVHELRLEARLVRWRPGGTDSEVTVMAFGEVDGPVSIPGPLLRVPEGTDVRITVRNLIPEGVQIGLPPPNRRRDGLSSIADPVLVVHGLRAGTTTNDRVRVPTGEEIEVRFRADIPGTYFYWGAMSDATVRERTGRDSQLTGAIVVDPKGVDPDPDERIFVITMLDAFPDETMSPPGEDIMRPAINGLSWPYTERLHYRLGDTVRWRWINGSGLVHPMHLHGFHFRTLARGDGLTDTSNPADAVPLVVTEHLDPGETFRMEWVPTRIGHWLMHCHVLDHIIPEVPRDDDARAHDLHDVTQHPFTAMGGLVLGIIVSDSRTANTASDTPYQRLRLIAQERHLDEADCSESLGLRDPCMIRGFGIGDGAAVQHHSLMVPGPPLVLTRGETTEITVVNRLSEPTTVHWHGMELESVYDGVAGWSRTGSRIAPLIAPGDSFTVYMTPPRAGTFMYHTHMDETDQLATGMYGPMLVMEPGEAFDPKYDLVFVIGSSVEYWVTVNGRRRPAPLRLQAGAEYRLRFINIHRGATVTISLLSEAGPERWHRSAKDGAELPPPLRAKREARLRFGAGETYDFIWKADASGDRTLLVHAPFDTEVGESLLRQTLHVD
jgi:manganese oxidase